MEATQLSIPLGMEVTDKGIAMLEQYVAAVRDASAWKFRSPWTTSATWA